MVELDNLFTFSPVCAMLKAMFQKEGQEEDCLSAVVLLWHFWASWSLWQGEEQDDNSERAGHTQWEEGQGRRAGDF